ncbi:3-hydroxy-3-methylglutaryl-coenzyme A reductase-like isoform X1 [Oratosquilla oratoria]|uniref:3-hydroxy-3-methylglutaryl-coenzyme A reductase-like isoform X1 n=1 Tax=Oratosquilla oratoria TaxID=337810 RepID=UPI003F76A6AD
MCCLVSGVSRLEQMCGFACLSVVVVNYLVLVMFYPACLSLVLKLSNRCSLGQPPWQMASLARALGDHKKPNPVVQRVKVIMLCRAPPPPHPGDHHLAFVAALGPPSDVVSSTFH